MTQSTTQQSTQSTQRCEVVFYSSGGSRVDSIYTEKGSTITLPVPEKVGYTFLGWYTGDGPNDTQFTVLSVVNNNLALFARWEINQYTISFDSDDGTPIESITQDYNTDLVQPNNPTKMGYTFLGWYIDENFENEFSFTKMPGVNLTLYAKYVLYGIYFDEDTGTIYGYSGPLSNIILPSEINGVTVSSIGREAFRYKRLLSVTIPSSVTTIMSYAFANNFLTEIIIPNGVVTIEDYAFIDNYQTSSITISESVESIGSAVFSKYQITNITIQGDESRFNDLWVKIGFPASMHPTSITDGDYIFYPEKNTILEYLGSATDITIPSEINGIEVKSIGYMAFRGKELTSVLLPSCVTSIDDYAFSYNHIQIIFLSNITSIGTSAFYNNDISYVLLSNNLTSIGANAFSYNDLTSITLPNSLTNIGNHAFSANKLTSITIPSGVTIGNGAFMYNSLSSVTIANGVTELKSYLFAYNNISSITIPNTVVSIGDRAFYVNNLQSITIFGDQYRFNSQWESIGFPSELKP